MPTLLDLIFSRIFTTVSILKFLDGNHSATCRKFAQWIVVEKGRNKPRRKSRLDGCFVSTNCQDLSRTFWALQRPHTEISALLRDLVCLMLWH